MILFPTAIRKGVFPFIAIIFFIPQETFSMISRVPTLVAKSKTHGNLQNKILEHRNNALVQFAQKNYHHKSDHDDFRYSSDNNKIWDKNFFNGWAGILSLFGLSSLINNDNNNEDNKKDSQEVTDYFLKKLQQANDTNKLEGIAREIIDFRKMGVHCNINSLVEFIAFHGINTVQYSESRNALINFFKILAQNRIIERELIKSSELLLNSNNFFASEFCTLGAMGIATANMGVHIAKIITSNKLQSSQCGEYFSLFYDIINERSAEIELFKESIEKVIIETPSFSWGWNWGEGEYKYRSLIKNLVSKSNTIPWVHSLLTTRFSSLEKKSIHEFSKFDYAIIEEMMQDSRFHPLLQPFFRKFTDVAQTTPTPPSDCFEIIQLGLNNSLIDPAEVNTLFDKIIYFKKSEIFLVDYLAKINRSKKIWSNYLLNNFEKHILSAPANNLFHIYSQIDDITIISKCLEKLSTPYFHKSEQGIKILEAFLACTKNNKPLKNIFVPWIRERASTLPASLVAYAIQCKPCDEELLNLLADDNSDEKNKLKLLYLRNCPGYLPEYLKNLNSEKSTSHERHVTKNRNSLASECSIPWIKSPALLSMFFALNQKTKELEKEKYYTFVHGQRWNMYFTEKWFTYLWQLQNNQQCPDYLFMHINQQFNNLTEETKLRKKILESGRLDDGDFKTRNRLLFMNWAFFANSKNRFSNTACYTVQNSNINDFSFSLKAVFAHYQFNAIYEKFKEELEEVEREHKKISNYGNLALIAIPKKLLKKTTYAAFPGGFKKQVEMIDGKSTDDIELIMDTLQKHPEKIQNSDNIEFCLVMTHDLALNPKSGIKIFSFNAADKEKLKLLEYREQLLLEKIKDAVHKNPSVDSLTKPLDQYHR